MEMSATSTSESCQQFPAHSLWMLLHSSQTCVCCRCCEARGQARHGDVIRGAHALTDYLLQSGKQEEGPDCGSVQSVTEGELLCLKDSHVHDVSFMRRLVFDLWVDDGWVGNPSCVRTRGAGDHVV